MTKTNETNNSSLQQAQGKLNSGQKPKVLIKTPVSYYWGKQMMLKNILPLIPDHQIYVEPFFWGGSVYRAKAPAPCEVINDVNMNVVNFYQVLKSRSKKLEAKIKETLLSRETYKKAMLIYDCPRLFADDKVTRAWAFRISVSQGYLNKIWSRWYDREKRSALNFQNKVDAFGINLAQRMKYTQIESADGCKVIKSRDTENTFFYCDPPYINTNMGFYKWYSEQDFISLLETLAQVKWKFLLSNYPWEILDSYIKKHNRYIKTFDKPLSASHNRKTGKVRRKTEVLVANYPI